MKHRSGQLLLIVLLLSLFAVHLGRVLFQEKDPAFFIEKPPGLLVELGAGFPEPAIHQFIDGKTWMSVIELTGWEVSPSVATLDTLQVQICTGQKVDLELKNDTITGLSVSWMSAARRIALGIPLHPDRMSESDWQILPGIGEKLARRIALDRQKNGEFGTLQALTRVPGIGEKRLSSWNQYFFTDYR